MGLVGFTLLVAGLLIVYRNGGFKPVVGVSATGAATSTSIPGIGVVTATRDAHTVAITLTPSAVPALALNFSAISKDLYTPVNVRAGPGKDFDVIGQLYTSDVAQILAPTTPANPSTTIWYLVHTLQGKTGWVSGEVIDVLPTNIDPQRVPIVLTIPPPAPVIAQTPSPSRG